MDHIQKEYGLTERRACQLIRQPRSTNRYKRRGRAGDDALTKEIKALSRKNPRYGYRRVTVLLRKAGWMVNSKRVHRIWKKEGLKVPQRKRKKRRVGTSTNSSQVLRAEHKDHVWSYDFLADMTTDGGPIRILALVDEHTRECLVLDVAKSIKADDVRRALKALFLTGRMPRYIRSDNGPEFIEAALCRWFKDLGVETAFIEPGSPWENAYVESFNSRFRDEFLDRRTFESIREARHLANDYRRRYNEERPHSSLDYLTPSEFAQQEATHNHAA